MTIEIKPNIIEVSHRDSSLRKFQNKVAKHIPRIIGFFDKLGAFPNTRIHDVMQKKEVLQADDITLTQLQMTDYICKTIEQKKFFPSFFIEYILTSFLNGADGTVARQLGTVTKEGGIKDAVVDRLSEVMVARLIAKELPLSNHLSHDLQVAFQLSTLTKAASEMSDVKTSEGGVGSMIERRKTLFLILNDLINLNLLPNAAKPIRQKLINKINKQVEFLIEGSRQRALQRIKAIAQKTSKVVAPSNPESSGASEARKYAGIVLINNLIGIDIVAEMNKLAGGEVIFPTIPSLLIDQKYILESLTNAKVFLEDAIEISGLDIRKKSTQSAVPTR